MATSDIYDPASCSILRYDQPDEDDGYTLDHAEGLVDDDDLEDDYFHFRADEPDNEGAVPSVKGGFNESIQGNQGASTGLVQAFMKNRIQSVYYDMRIENTVDYVCNLKESEAVIGPCKEDRGRRS